MATMMMNKRGQPPSSSSSTTSTSRSSSSRRTSTTGAPSSSSTSLLCTSSSSSSNNKKLLYVAVYLYMAALYVYFAVGFAFLNRYLSFPDVPPSTSTRTEAAATDDDGNDGSLTAGTTTTTKRRIISLLRRGDSNGNGNHDEGEEEAREQLAPAVTRGGASSAVVPLVARRDTTGNWSPSPSLLNASITTIRSNFFDAPSTTSTGIDQIISNLNKFQQRKRQAIGVVRITKTGSTSLLSFLAASTAAQTFDQSLRHDDNDNQVVDSTSQHVNIKNVPVAGDKVVIPYCFFEPHRRQHPQPQHVDSSAKKRIRKYVDQYPAANGKLCGHRTYARMVSYLMSTLPDAYLDDDELQVGPKKNAEVELSMSIITMVRDPYDRMLSFFRYFREIYPAWAPMYHAQPAVLRTLLDGNFPEFLHQLSMLEPHEWTRRYQYEYFGVTIDEALQVVHDVQVLPLLNECFNASMLLLANQYPHIFPSDQPAATHRFLNSNSAHSRPTGANATLQNHLHPDLHPTQEFDAAEIKQQAIHTWLRDEYKFYDASKQLLGRMLQHAVTEPGSIVDHDTVRQCLNKIGWVEDSSAGAAAVA